MCPKPACLPSCPLQPLLHSAGRTSSVKFPSAPVPPLLKTFLWLPGAPGKSKVRMWLTRSFSVPCPPSLCLFPITLHSPAYSQREHLSVHTPWPSHMLFPLPRNSQEPPSSKSFVAHFYSFFRSQLRPSRMPSLPPTLNCFRNPRSL